MMLPKADNIYHIYGYCINNNSSPFLEGECLYKSSSMADAWICIFYSLHMEWKAVSYTSNYMPNCAKFCFCFSVWHMVGLRTPGFSSQFHSWLALGRSLISITSLCPFVVCL